MALYTVDFSESQATAAPPKMNVTVKTSEPVESIQFTAYGNGLSVPMDDLISATVGQTMSVTIKPLSDDVGTVPAGEMSPERRQFFESVYTLDARDPEEALDLLVDRLDDLQTAGNFDEVDALLYGLKPAKLSAPSIVSVLGITLAAKEILNARRIFYRLALRAVAQQRGSEEAATKLLAKYR
jgi:hypothetical protein